MLSRLQRTVIAIAVVCLVCSPPVVAQGVEGDDFGSVACWGYNGAGQCDVPTGIGTLENPVASVAAGGYHTAVLLADGSVTCWGYNFYGQCNVPGGIGTLENPVASVAAGIFHTVALLADGSVVCWGDNIFGQCSVPSGIGTPENPVASVAAGADHTVAVLADGSVACWGYNSSGQCDVPSGIGTPANPVAAVAAGTNHTVALLADGSVACWGSNSESQCDVPSGIGTLENPVAGVAAGAYHTVALLADGSVACWGLNIYGLCDVPDGIGTPENPVASVAAGEYHTVALLADGSVACWGYNKYGQCDVPGGIGTPENPVAAVAAGNDLTVVVSPFAVHNRTSGTYADSLRSALQTAEDGDDLAVRSRAFDDDGVIVIEQSGLGVVVKQSSTMPTGLTLRLGSDMVFENDGHESRLAVSGQMIAKPDDAAYFQSLDLAAGGRFIQNGASIYVTGAFDIAGGRAFLSGQMAPSVLRTSGDGEVRVAGDVDAFCDYENAGTTIVQRGVLFVYGDLTNTGTLVGDVNNGFLPPEPGDGLSIGGDYTVGREASISLPDPVWRLAVGGDFDVEIDEPSRFTMGLATLELTGLSSGGTQLVEATSADLGSTEEAFDDSNNLIGEFRLRAGTTVEIVDTHDNISGDKTCEVIYTDRLVVPAGATLITSGCPVHVREAVIDGTVSDPDDIVVFDPNACPGDLDGDGRVQGSDLGILFTQWGGPGTADFDGDGIVQGSDLGLLFTMWGDCE
jgi:alpha-tubulin suppressor-like RCC1 family protein